MTDTPEIAVDVEQTPTPSWSDNPVIKRLVGYGLILQFLVPLIACIVLLCAVNFFMTFEWAEGIYAATNIACWGTIILFVIQYPLYNIVLAAAPLKFALGFFIIFNIIHSVFWLSFGLPLTIYRLAIPTILYGIALGYDFRQQTQKNGT